MSRKNRNIKNINISKFYCLECKTEIELPRFKSDERKEGHIKDIYCTHCKTVTKHLELRERDMFNSIIDELIIQAKEQVNSNNIRIENVKLNFSIAN